MSINVFSKCALLKSWLGLRYPWARGTKAEVLREIMKNEWGSTVKLKKKITPKGAGETEKNTAEA